MENLKKTVVARQPYHFMADMFNPIIVWDTSRRDVAAKMTAGERKAIARRATHNLRENLPEIMRSFSTYDVARADYADATILNAIDKEGLLEEKESARTKKRLVDTEEILAAIDSSTQEYCAQAGYRAACLSFLIGNTEIRVDCDQAFKGLAALCESQQTIFQALLLQDLLRLSRKYVQNYLTFDFEVLNDSYISKFKRRISLLRITLESLDTPLGGISTAQFMDNLRARNPVFTDGSLNDPALGLSCEFAIIRECFEKLNEELSATIARGVEESVAEQSDWNLRLVGD